jgi:hypothetical protein
MPLENVPHETLNALLAQKLALGVASATVATGLASKYDVIEGWMSLTAIGIGILLSSALLVKAVLVSIKTYKEIKLMDEHARTRRKSDKKPIGTCTTDKKDD